MFNVICVDNSYNPFLTPNEMYFVEEENETHYKIHNDAEKMFWYDKNLFKKVQDKQKIKVLCVKNTGLANITVDRVYDAEEWGDKNYLLVDDEYKKVIINKRCFIRHIVEITIKPPLGLKPRKIYWEELNYHRRKDIIAAMQRRMEAKMDIPIEWCKELIDLVVGASHE